jgi:hypothetical protein
MSFARAGNFARIVEQNENCVLASSCAHKTFCAWFRGPNPVERKSGVLHGSLWLIVGNLCAGLSKGRAKVE